MREQLRVGVVGTSWWADMHHLPYLKSHPQAQIAAICGRNKERAEKIAGKYEIPVVYTNYREMIEKGDLQALIASVPDDIHHTVVMAALDAGLHVICEKPMAMNVAQAQEMTDRALEKKVKHMTYFTWRWLPHYRYIKSLIDDGYIGRCYHCHIQWFTGAVRNRAYAWRFDRNHGSGVLGDLGSHATDFARLLVGEVAGVSANLSTHIALNSSPEGTIDPADDSAMLMLDFESGAQGLIHVSAVSHIGNRVWDQRMLLHGDAGSIEVSSTIAGTTISGSKEGEKEFQPLPIPDRYWENADKKNPFSVFTTQSVGARLFIDSILEDKDVSPGFEDGLVVQKVLDAARASHEQGVRIVL